MIRKKIVLIFSFLISILLLQQTALADEKWFVGSEKCQECHWEQFNDWQSSGHPFKLRKAEKVRYTGVPLPKGYNWDDISYVIGGATKKARFIDNNGFIITKAKDGSPAKTQYNLQTGTWANYNAGKVKPYKCGPCHMTAYSPKGHQDGLPGMIGTWAESGIGCEECHGPGSAHAFAKEPKKATITRDTEGKACGKCHQRSGMDIPPLASGGFIRHHEQFNEINIGAHEGTDCVECHNPHKRAINVKAQCTDCHDDSEFKEFASSTHGLSGVTCVDCHMPKATKSAVKTGKFEGDTRTHLFKINLNPNANMFKSGKLAGKKVTFAQSFVTLDFACLNCHGARDKKWAAQKAKDYHKH